MVPKQGVMFFVYENARRSIELYTGGAGPGYRSDTPHHSRDSSHPIQALFIMTDESYFFVE
jgi:hypothetical protein